MEQKQPIKKINREFFKKIENKKKKKQLKYYLIEYFYM